MKSMRMGMVVGKIDYFAVLSPADDGSGFFSRNLTSVTPFHVVSLAVNSNSSSGNLNGPYEFNPQFNVSTVIIVLLLVAAFFFISFFAVYMRHCTTDEGGTRASRGANAQGRNGREATRGLDRTVIESFPVFSYNLVKGLKAQAKGTECAVCLSDFQDDEMLRLLPKCSHAFHPECIDMWLCSHTTCPICRTSLLPEDESNPTGTHFGVVEPVAVEQAQTEQVTVIVDTDEATNANGFPNWPPATKDERHDSPILGVTSGVAENIRRSHSTGHSLVRVRKELEQGNEWYIATPGGLTPGLHRSCSFVAMHHPRSQGPSTSKEPSCSKAGGSMGDVGCSSGEGYRARSERWGAISINPAAFLRSFSERRAPQAREQRGTIPQQPDRRAYLKKTLNWLTGREREKSDSSQHGSVSSRHGDRSTTQLS